MPNPAARAPYDAFFDAAPDALLVVDATGKILLANRQVTAVFGYEPDELVGRGVETLIPQRYHGAHGGHRTRFMEQPKTRPMGAQRELWGVRKDGREFPVEVSLSPIEWTAGSIVLAAVRDASQRRAVETELRRRNGDLESFAYVVSHDLRAPLRGLHLHLDLLEEAVAGGESAKVQQAMENIRARAARLESMIDGVLEYSRKGKAPEGRTPLDLRRLVEEAISSMDVPPGFVVQVAPLPRVSADRTQIQQVFQNLVGNAVQHHDRASGHITVSSRDAGDHYEFTVADDGPGIPPGDEERIFQIFYTARSQGTGVGLAIVRRIIEVNGGRIRVEPARGRGATFRFTWPKLPDAVHEEAGGGAGAMVGEVPSLQPSVQSHERKPAASGGRTGAKQPGGRGPRTAP